MQHAEVGRLPFWDAPSIVDVPYVVMQWQEVTRAAEAKAQPEKERIQRKRAQFSAR